MFARLQDRYVALGLVAYGSVQLALSLGQRAHVVTGPLGIEAGFSVVMLAYAFARRSFPFRTALLAMAPGLGAQVTLLLRHDATFAWLGGEALLVGLTELVVEAASYLLAPSDSTGAAPRVTTTRPWSVNRSTRRAGKPFQASI